MTKATLEETSLPELPIPDIRQQFDTLVLDNKKKFLETKLHLVDNKELNLIDTRFDLLRKNRATSHVTETMARFDKKAKKVFVPNTFFDYDNLIGLAFIRTFSLFNIEVVQFLDTSRLYDLNADTTYKAEIAMGFALGMDDRNVVIKLKDHKEKVEQGRAYVMALRVQHHFASNPTLGRSALRKNQKYLGNDPGLDENGYKKLYAVRQEFVALFRNKDSGEICYDLLLDLINLTGFDGWNNEPYETNIKSNLVSLPDVLVRFFRQRTVNLGRGRTQVKWVGPKKPSQSPLLLKEEMNIIADFLSPLFKEYGELTKNWYNIILKKSFPTLVQELSDEYRRKWSAIDGFAKLTTKRLRQFKKLNPTQSNKKKADISQEDVKSLLKQRKSLLRGLSKELLDLISDQDTKVSLWENFCGHTSPDGRTDISEILKVLQEKSIYPEDLMKNQEPNEGKFVKPPEVKVPETGPVVTQFIDIREVGKTLPKEEFPSLPNSNRSPPKGGVLEKK